jgi:uncharacterized OB-fold protein
MPFFDSQALVPQPNFDDRDFWASCDHRLLRFQCCALCQQARHPPMPVCPHCRSLKVGWQDSCGQGTVFTFTVVHHASHEAVKPKLPYVVAVIIPDDVSGVRWVSNITDIPSEDVHIGMSVEVWWDEVMPGRFVPRCRPLAAQALKK